MVSINVDEAALRDMRPEINSPAAIRLWAQELIDLRLKEMRAEDEETMSIDVARKMTHQAVHEVYAMPDRDMTPDELYDVIAKEIDIIYAQG